eukprot:TRINITY_DN63092_c0_g1_i2.p1 TRINITY_DN63092_c0_g1~~TRINITY_DN63092_c0_g1_i2.p1  ORF type:complete len:326 (+),score=187.79 TRINITY_DN63092_c0_g1_i2:126-1103(+)
MRNVRAHPTVATCNELAKIYLERGQLDDLRQLYDAVKKQRMVRRTDEEGELYANFVVGFFKAGHFDLVSRVFDDINRRRVLIDPKRTEVYDALVQGFSVLGEPATVFSIFREIKDRQLSISNPTYAALISTAGVHGSLTDVAAVREHMEAHDVTPDRTIHQALVHAYGMHGDVHEAESIWTQQLRDSAESELDFFALMTAYVRVGEWNKLVDLVREMRASEAVRMTSLGCTQFAKFLTVAKRRRWAIPQAVVSMVHDKFLPLLHHHHEHQQAGLATNPPLSATEQDAFERLFVTGSEHIDDFLQQQQEQQQQSAAASHSQSSSSS